MLQAGVELYVIAAAETERVVDDVRSPVEELSAAVPADGLPVAPTIVVVPGQLDLVHVAENAGIDDLHRLLEAAFKPTVVADVEMRACRFTAQRDKLLRLRERHGKRLFEHDVLARLQCHFRVSVVVTGTGGDRNQFNPRIG